MNYLSDPARVRLETGAIDGLKLLEQHGYPLVVLSNQSGIGRGMFTDGDARSVNHKVHELLHQQGIDILAWYMCPHAPDEGCDCRKPMPGMAAAASRDLGLPLSGSYVVGDTRADVELADAIGGTGILVTTGHGGEFAEWARAQRRPVVPDLRAAAEYITDIERRKSTAP